MAPDAQATSGDVTGLLKVWSEGDERAFDRLIPLVYAELHRMAHRYLARERADVSMQATGLVNEICLRLLGWDPVRWENRGHFFGVSAQMMRRVLVDIARRRRADRRGGEGAIHVGLDGIEVAAEAPHEDLLAIDVERIVSRLPTALREVCEGLQRLSLRELSVELGVPRTTILRRLEEIRERFQEAGLDDAA